MSPNISFHHVYHEVNNGAYSNRTALNIKWDNVYIKLLSQHQDIQGVVLINNLLC